MNCYFGFLSYFFGVGGHEPEDPYPSLSDYHDYEPNLEFDDTELVATVGNGEKLIYYYYY